MKLSKSVISVGVLAACLSAAGLRSDVRAGQTPSIVTLSGGNQTCGPVAPGASCQFKPPSASYSIGLVHIPQWGAQCCTKAGQGCTFNLIGANGSSSQNQAGAGSPNDNGSGTISGDEQWSLNASATKGQEARYRVELTAYCTLSAYIVGPGVVVEHFSSQPQEFTWTVTN